MSERPESLNFIEHIIERDLADGMPKTDLRFRFPPEPNGYLHIGHTKAIGISFGLGEKYKAPVNLRFDDTNPAKEEQEYVDAIKKDIAWLGYTWDQELYSSNYFQQLYDWAVVLIKEGKAYVDFQSSEAMAEQKGTPTQVGVNSPYRDRTVQENLDLFEGMKAGKFDEGTHVLRAKIDMEDPNMLMRDPLMYRILKKTHHRTGDDWCIYPMYDWTHGESDYIEQVSHSLCSLEFKPHRKLYNWFRDEVYSHSAGKYPNIPHQTEFARLNLSYTIMSKRKLLRLVEENIVHGWDDPRMPTISGLRRRGYTPKSIRTFVEKAGVAKRENVIDVSLLEFCIREDLNNTAPRAMAVLNPLKLVITNFVGQEEELNIDGQAVPFSNEIYIEKEDFREEAGANFYRLTLGNEVRLKGAYIVKANKVVKNEDGTISEVHCTYDVDTLSGSGSEASLRKVKGTLHWVSANHAIEAEVRLYDRLFTDPTPDSHDGKTFMDFINPNSLEIKQVFLQPYLKSAKPGDSFQFQRLGYFHVDDDSTKEHLVFNKTVGLKESSSKQKTKQNASSKPQDNRSAIDKIKSFGKKYDRLPPEAREEAKAKIIAYAKEVSYEDIEPLFATSVKKSGTRIITMIALGVLLNNGAKRTPEANEFIEKALEDKNKLLVEEANTIAK